MTCFICRPRLAEMASVLKAITTLLKSLKQAPPGNGIFYVLYLSLGELTTNYEIIHLLLHKSLRG